MSESDVFREMSNTGPGRGAQSDEDADLALAKLLQAQERELFLLGGANSYGDWGQGTVENISPEADDETIARQLMETERREQMQRMLAMAGIGPGVDQDALRAAGIDASEQDFHDVDDEMGPSSDGTREDVAPEEDARVDRMSYEELLALGEVEGAVSKGAKAETLEGLPVVRFGGADFVAAVGSRREDGGEEEEQCAVCRMEFDEGDELKVLPCKHFYHAECADQWLTINRACPVCFQDIDAEQGT